MNLEALALRRAEEQVTSDAWKVKDADEASEPLGCRICGGEIGNRRGGAVMCPACREAGWSAVPCKGCGGLLRRSDQQRKSRDRRGYCSACRSEMPQVQRGAETLALYRARLAEGKAA